MNKRKICLMVASIFIISSLILVIESFLHEKIIPKPIMVISFFLGLASFHYVANTILISLDHEKMFPSEKVVELTNGGFIIWDLKRYENLFAAIVEIIMASLGILLSIPFTPTYPISHYERLQGIPVGERWYVGVIFIGFTFLVIFILRILRGKPILTALYSSVFVLFWIVIMALILNSLWQYGVFVYEGYFISYKIFFTSELVVSIVLGLISTSAIVITRARGIRLEKI